MIRYYLTPEEISFCITKGIARWEANKELGKPGKFMVTRNPDGTKMPEHWNDVHCMSAETIIATRRCGRTLENWVEGNLVGKEFWDRRHELRDVGKYEVRSTQHWRGKLLIYPKDHKTLFWHVRTEGFPDHVDVMGVYDTEVEELDKRWLWSKWENPAYFIPHHLINEEDKTWPMMTTLSTG